MLERFPPRLVRGTSNPKWQVELLSSYTTPRELELDGLLTAIEAAQLAGLSQRFRVRIPRYYAALMDNTAGGRDRCPIRKQALPHLAENDPVLPAWGRAWSQRAFGRETPWTDDAIGDVAKLAAPRLTHRYGNRAIVHLSSLCALYCRFCFRKSHLNDAERTLYDGSLEPALAYVRATHEIRELILTGGDPLSLPDAWLNKFLGKLEDIPHLKQVRVHSRMAVTLPSRLTAALTETLSDRPFLVSLVSHFNHPRELTNEAREGLRRLRLAGIPLYNQTVLLAGVNDDEETLYSLFQNLYETGVTPFYLHHPDWTPGTFHFRLPIARGRALMHGLRGRLSGPASPDYVLDLPGGDGKISLLGEGLREIDRHAENGISGALHALTTPHTRQGHDKPVLYAEFWKE